MWLAFFCDGERRVCLGGPLLPAFMVGVRAYGGEALLRLGFGVVDVEAALLVLPLEESECCMGVRLDIGEEDGADMGGTGRWWWLFGG